MVIRYENELEVVIDLGVVLTDEGPCALTERRCKKCGNWDRCPTGEWFTRDHCWCYYHRQHGKKSAKKR